MCICGDPDAQYFWGFDLLYNTFGNGDDKQAFQWLEKASSSSRIARVDLAKCYLNGWGCSADIDKGIELLRQCAEGKSKKARYELGLLYYLGKHVEQDYNKAFTLFEYAAQKNHASAQYYLGDMYFWGKGVVKDEAKAFEWNKKSADNGNRFGCESIAYQYWNGRVVPKKRKTCVQVFQRGCR
jgi:TPR repeat protein